MLCRGSQVCLTVSSATPYHHLMGLIAAGLRDERRRQGLTQREIAHRAGISRQGYIAIEAGAAVPSTEIALRLGSVLNAPVERLFRLADGLHRMIVARAGSEVRIGARVRIARVGDRVLAFDAGAGGAQRTASGVVSARNADRVEVLPLPSAPIEPDLVVAGCDPALGVIGDLFAREQGLGILWSPMGSRAALEALARGDVHVAGTHLRDPGSTEYNVGWVREVVPFPCTVVRFAEWEQCLVTTAGNPHHVRSVEDLANPALRLLNREPGSGSRALLDELLQRAAIPSDRVTGYETRAPGHMAVAGGIAAGAADAGIAIRAAAAAFGLDFVHLRSERYDLVVPDHFLEFPAVRRLLDCLRGSSVRRQVESLGGYDVGSMGLPA